MRTKPPSHLEARASVRFSRSALKSALLRPSPARVRLLLLSAAIVVMFPVAGVAQWFNQTITLHAGWNAVFLEVQPEPRDCDTVFAGVPIESVWMWNRRFSTVQFIADPNTLIPGDPDWLTWLPASHASRSIMNLRSLLGGRTYLIKASTAATRTLQGRSMVRRVDWLSDSLNLVGFPVDPFSPPTFQNFFAPSPAHSGTPAYHLTASGAWTAVNAAVDRIQSGEAYWVPCTGPSTYSGLLTVTVEQGRGVDYGRILTEQTLRIRNNSTTARVIGVRALSSGPPVNEHYPRLAGDVPLSYWKMDFAASQVGFFPLPTRLTSTIAAGAEWTLRLAVRRTDMAQYTPPLGATDVLYQSLLEVTDGAGSRLLVPVTAQGLQTYSSGGRGGGALGGFAAAASTPPSPRAGLWVGSAVVTNVSQPASFNPTIPKSTASGFQFRLLVHVDARGQARLLQQIIQMWKNGTYKPDPDDPSKRIVDEPGRFVLITDERFALIIPDLTGAALRDGQPVGRRFSTAAFGFRDPLPMTAAGDFGADGSRFVRNVELDYDDELNPFKHRYHPDHNNYTEDYELKPKLPEGIESFTVNRLIELQFTATDPDDLRLAGWGDTQLGGTYRETITGLHKDAIYLLGNFRMHHASRVAVLNDGL